MISALSRRRRLTVLGLGLALLGSAVSIAPSAQAAVWRPFADNSPFNTRIAAGPALDPNSSAMVDRATRTGALHANLVAYGVPIASASSSSPTYQVTCTMGWGTCPFSGRSMPIPTGATPSPGSDGALVVVDQASGTAGEYWRAAPGGNGWVAGWGAVNSLSGSGWGGASTGSGASRLGGVVRASEIQAGWIDHALVLQTDNVCRGTYRAPALKTDGDSTRSDCLPEGARLQLDPSIDVSSLPGITSAERTVARALQLYGGYVIDRGGSPLSVSFEKLPGSTTTSPGAAYVEAGLRWDYDGLPHVPWNRLRVLAG